MIKRGPHSLGLALGEIDELVADGATFTADSAAPAAWLVAPESMPTACEDVAVQERGVA
jgi:hypothetical protein